MNFLNRRDFLHSTAGLGALATGAHVFAQPQRAGSANETINVCCIGVRGQGMSHVRGYAGKHNCVVTHVCDTDSAVVGPALKAAEDAQKVRPQYVQDLRRIMDNKDIHAVSIATPNHWHALAAIWAMQSGKDVYVEKPVSHNVLEGRLMVQAARKYNKICQTGTQIRSQPGSIEAIKFIQSGKLGKVKVARGLCYKTRNSIGKVTGEQAVPNTVDYDIWCGPAPRKPLMRSRLHYDWHWVWDTGNGDLGNQGIHQMDVARWGLGKNELAKSCLSIGGRFGYVDDGETANTQVAVFDYGDAQLIFEVRGLKTAAYRGATVGNVFHCENGTVVFTSYSSAIAYDDKGQEIQRFQGAGDHFGNFIRAVRSKRKEDLHADIEEGHYSSALCHLANISHRLGAPASFDAQRQAFNGNEAATETLERTRQHLRDNMAIPADGNFTLGKNLVVDPKTESFVNDVQANRWLTREYRAGYEVPTRF